MHDDDDTPPARPSLPLPPPLERDAGADTSTDPGELVPVAHPPAHPRRRRSFWTLLRSQWGAAALLLVVAGAGATGARAAYGFREKVNDQVITTAATAAAATSALAARVTVLETQRVEDRARQERMEQTLDRIEDKLDELRDRVHP